MASFAIEQRRDGFLVDKATSSGARLRRAGDRLAELLARLTALDEERAAIVAEIKALRTKTSKTRLPLPPFCISERCRPRALAY